MSETLPIRDVRDLLDDPLAWGLVVAPGAFDALLKTLENVGLKPIETQPTRYALLGPVGLFESEHTPVGYAAAIDREGKVIRMYRLKAEVVNILEKEKTK